MENAPREVLADRRSQRILHNTWGITLLIRLFGETLTRPSDGAVISVRPLLESHIQRDLGYIPTLEESVDGIEVETWMYRGARPLSRTLAER